MTRHFEHDYLDLIRAAWETGDPRADRTGVGTRALFGRTLDVDLTRGFPATTTKRLAFKGVLSERLWILEGSGDERRLAEILHGTRDPAKRTIWTDNAEGTTGSRHAPAYPGDLGRVYGVQERQWRRFSRAEKAIYNPIMGDGSVAPRAEAWVENPPLDQVAEVVRKLRESPADRRMMVSSWNPGELDQMALPPCHYAWQVFARSDGSLELMFHMRSVDLFLGLPFDVASYALLAHMLAQVTGRRATRLFMTFGDTHVYQNHGEAVATQLARAPAEALPTLWINPEIKELKDFTMQDFALSGYDPQPAIPAEMAK
jgi:thymidylate synthase